MLNTVREREKAHTGLDPYIWANTLDVVTAYNHDRLVFKFRNGLEIESQSSHSKDNRQAE